MSELLISEAESSHLPEETHFGRLYPRSRSFGHYPQLVTRGEGWNVGGPGNRELRLPAQVLLHHNGPVQQPSMTADAAPIRLSISCSIFPSLVNKTLRYLNSFAWGSKSLPTRMGALPRFPAENHGHGLGGADSHPDRFTLSCKPPQCMLEVTV